MTAYVILQSQDPLIQIAYAITPALKLMKNSSRRRAQERGNEIVDCTNMFLGVLVGVV
jgi:hypothetical protein